MLAATNQEDSNNNNNNNNMCNTNKQIIAAIDQGTSSSRFLIFAAETGQEISFHQIEINKIYPREGWVEQCPKIILGTVLDCIENVAEKLPQLGLSVQDIACVGLTNQRESTILWNKVTGEPLYNSIVWLDNRTSELVDTIVDKIPGRDLNHLKSRTGLPISTYFSALKIRWLFENVPEVGECHRRGELLFGNVDAWLLWNLTGEHRTDVTNASRTLLMNLETLEWDAQLCEFFHIPVDILPEIRSSADAFGVIQRGPLAGVPVTCMIGDQNAALVGQKCLHVGQSKVTYGTGAFLMQNIGPAPLHGALADVPKDARHKLLTTIGYKLSGRSACYALEGSIAIAGAALTWLRDNLELIDKYGEVETLVKQEQPNGSLCFVPAFQGLYAPYWDPAATGIIIGISQFTKKCHLVRATVEGVAFQTNDVITLMKGRNRQVNIKVDGGMSSNDFLCQTLADVSGINIIRPKFTETTALGAAMLAAYQVGIWPELGVIGAATTRTTVMQPSQTELDHNENIVGTSQEQEQRRQRRTSSSATDLIDSAFSLVRSSINSILHPAHDLVEDVDGVLQAVPNVGHFDQFDPSKHHIFCPAIAEDSRVERIRTWREAVRRCRRWVRVERQERKRIDYLRLSMLPITMYALGSIALCLLSQRA